MPVFDCLTSRHSLAAFLPKASESACSLWKEGENCFHYFHIMSFPNHIEELFWGLIFFFFFYCICIKCKHSLLALVLNIAFSEFTDDFQIVWNVLCLWQASWEIYECNQPPVLQGSLNKLMCQHNENEQQAAVDSQGPSKTAQGQEVLEINNLYALSSAFKM